MTPEVKEIVDAFARKMDDRELLIRIDERGEVYQKNIDILFEKATKLDTKVDGLFRVRDMVSGAVGLVGFLGMILGVVLTFQRITVGG